MFSAEHESIDHIENLQVHDCLQPTAGDHLCRRLLGHWAPSHNLSLNNHYHLILFLSVFNQLIPRAVETPVSVSQSNACIIAQCFFYVFPTCVRNIKEYTIHD